VVELYRSAFYELTEDRRDHVVTLARTSTPYPTNASVRAEVDRVVECFESRHRELGIVVDMRSAPGRNDPEFEAAMRHLRFAVGQAFARVVVLVATASGQMQASRLHREGGVDYGVSRDPAEARELASGMRGTDDAGPCDAKSNPWTG
jgi:hypothetical protein